MNTTMKMAMLGVGACLVAGAAWAADPTTTADVLDKLHRSNLTQIEAGKLAQDNGHSKATQDYGKTLVSDYTSADKQVVALAKEEGIDVSDSTPVVGTNKLAELSPGPAFDRRFARTTLGESKKGIAAVTAARDATTDAKLKALLTDLLPALQKHEGMAEKLEHGK